jgi:hypothetical protein
VDLNLTSKQVKEICEGSVDEVDVNPTEEETISQAALRIARATRNSGDMSGADLARALMRQERDANLARARLQMIRRLLDEADKHLQGQ